MTSTPEALARSYQLKITLLDVRPPVWRRIVVPGRITLAALHHVLQVAMGWEDEHLHDFDIGGVFYGRIVEEEDEEHMLDEISVRLEQVVKSKGTRFIYRYDFGDEWRHEVLVERIEPTAETGGAVRCLAGCRAVPPENCGGPPGYEMLTTALKEPDNPVYRDMLAFFGNHDPSFFDLEAINRALESLDV